MSRYRWAMPLAAALAFTSQGSAAAEKRVELFASESYAKTVAAVCAALPYEARAHGLAYFLNSANIDAEPTRKTVEAFCAEFADAYPTEKAEGLEFLKALPEKGVNGPLLLDADQPEPQGFRIKLKIFGWEFDITIGKSPPSKDAETAGSVPAAPPPYDPCPVYGGDHEGPC
jgi:hypothetical protein